MKKKQLKILIILNTLFLIISLNLTHKYFYLSQETQKTKTEVITNKKTSTSTFKTKTIDNNNGKQKKINQTAKKNHRLNFTETNTKIDTKITNEQLNIEKNTKKTINVSLKLPNKSFNSKIKLNSTAYDLMVKLQKEQKINFFGQWFGDLGFFVEQINNIKNDKKNGYFWFFYINNKLSPVGISNYILKNNDLIEWRYEKNN